MSRNPRQIALQGLLEIEQDPRFCEEILDDLLINCPDLSDRDRRLAQELTLGVLRWESALDYLIQLLTRSRPQKARIKKIMALGLYQIFFLTRIPPHAAVSETVQLTRFAGAKQASGFVNAMLRQALRRKAELDSALEKLKKEDPAAAFSHPDWLVDRWLQRIGSDSTLQLLEWNNTPPSVFARLRPGWEQVEDSEVAESLFDPIDPINPVQPESSSHAVGHMDWIQPGELVRMKSGSLWRQSKLFLQGFLYLQDPSTLLAPSLLDPQPGETVLDTCSAPGGKSAVLWDRMQGRGTLVVEDLPGPRMERLRENQSRLGLLKHWITQSADPDPLKSGLEDVRQYDRVLIDAPCSNTGVLRRRIDLRKRIQPDSLKRIEELQRGLLTRSSSRVRPGGFLAYSTCSIEPEENQGMRDWFEQRFPEFNRIKERRLAPVPDGVDGAYCVVWVKDAS